MDITELFVDGERLLGRYTVVLLNQARNGRWMPSIMQLDASVTNYRLLLRPYLKKYRPASLPSQYIAEASLAKKDNYHCVELLLSTDHMLYMISSTGKLDNFCDDLNAMKVRPPKFQFDETVAREDIERLISFFGRNAVGED